MEITRIPKSIRQIKLKDFDKYGGNVQACVQAMAKERMAETEGEGHAKKRYAIFIDSRSDYGFVLIRGFL